MPTKKDSKDPLEAFRKVFTEVPAPKGGLPTMPTKISETSSDELGDIMCRYTAWREFTEDRHAEACAVYAQAKSQYDLALNQEMLKAEGETVTDRRASANTVQHVIKLATKMNEAEIYKTLLANKLDSFSNVLAMLSRELTRRGVAL